MRLSAVIATAGLVLAMAAPASAATYTVTSTADSGGTCPGSSCTIRAALTAAGGAAGADTIQLASSTYTLTSAPLALDSDVTLIGTSATATRITAAGKAFRVFAVTGAGRVATISRLRATGGNVGADAGGVGLVDAGASLTLDHTWIDAGTAARGGGLANRGGTLTLTDSLVSSNTATADGGAILNLGSGTGAATLSLTDVTVTLNKGATAGGIESLGSATNAVTAARATIAGNTSTTGTSGLSVGAGSAHVGGSLVTGGCDGTPTSDGGNVETTATCGFTQATDKSNVSNAANALVAAALVASGTGVSATQVLKIPATSAAVDAAGACAGTDQRDAARPQGAACDAGAYELPAARIDDKPPAKTNDNTPTFAFSSTVPGVTFQCSVRTTGTAFATCTSPFTAPAQVDGTYTFAVRAVDGGTAGVATSYTFVIDTPPTTAIQTGPSGPTNATNATFTYNANELSSTFQCALSGPGQTGAMGTCPLTGKTYSGLAQGDYTFSVVATDQGGTPDPTPETRSFTVDTTPPVVTVAGGPDDTTQDTSVSFSFSSEPGATFQCRLDAGAFKACTSPAAYDVAAAGPHTFSVRATDAAGNSSALATRAYTLEIVAAATPTPAPEPEPAPTAAPVIVAPPAPAPTGLLLTPVRGTTLVEAPGADAFEPLDGATRAASGSLVDARTSRVRLESGTIVSGGIFRLSASGLQLVERLKPCAGNTRKLTLDGTAVVRGQFATVTGTRAKWSVQDSCTSTTTRVTSGAAAVRDLVRRKTVRVRAHHGYTVRAKR